jgi:hypothetical protein
MTLELAVSHRDGEGAVHVRTADGQTIVAHIGADGHRVGGEGTLRVPVEPDTLYYLATSGGPNITPAEHKLIVSHTPEQWFRPKASPSEEQQ